MIPLSLLRLALVSDLEKKNKDFRAMSDIQPLRASDPWEWIINIAILLDISNIFNLVLYFYLLYQRSC